jgi:hypothetical protein
MKRLMTVLPLALFVVACSGGMSGGAAPEPPPPPVLDPTGVYDCLLDVDGMEIGATLTITGTPGAYMGTVDSDMGLAPVSDISVDGNEMTFAVDTPDMAVFFIVVFDGDNFTGEFDAGGMGGFISGKKR